MINIWNQYRFFIAALLISLGVSYGISVSYPFLNAFAFSLVLLLGLAWFLKEKEQENGVDMDQIKDNELKLKEFESIIQEQNNVIDEYEFIFDQQLVELPCICGDNIFKGLFTPNMENICECDKCKNKYKVLVSYDSVLISEPLENSIVFDKIKEESNKQLVKN